jgi:DNA-3-methyladenine glycosylase II
VTKPSAIALRALGRRDPRLAAAMRRLPAFPGFPDAAQRAQATHWDALSRAIVFQQLATAAATTIHRRVCALTGECFPRPEELLAQKDSALRAAGLSKNKIAALRDLASRIEDQRLDLVRLHHKDDAAIVEELVAVRGIGEWSAQMFLLFRLGRLDVGASGDLGVREGLRMLDGLPERPTPKVALARMEAWRPLRSVGCWLMWRLVEAQRAQVKSAAARPPTAKSSARPAARRKRASTC